MSQIFINSENNGSFSQRIAWTLFSLLLLSLLVYGLSFFFTKPKIETVATPPPASNSYINQTQDVDFQNKKTVKRSK
ncbi:MAG TPA: hypothetical protein PKY82_11070 [Pyrinomonadaceae bacterium]|nr:hypothetical protein [Pyrinomonadaceae bacterium]